MDAIDARVTTNTGDIAANTGDIAGPDTRVTTNTGDIATNTADIAALDTRVTTNTNDIAALDSRVSSLESSLGEIDGRIDKAFEGTAMALAMVGGGLPADKNFAVSLNWGTFEGENAFAGTAQARISENFFIHGGLGLGASQGTVGGRAGVTCTW